MIPNSRAAHQFSSTSPAKRSTVINWLGMLQAWSKYLSVCLSLQDCPSQSMSLSRPPRSSAWPSIVSKYHALLIYLICRSLLRSSPRNRQSRHWRRRRLMWQTSLRFLSNAYSFYQTGWSQSAYCWYHPYQSHWPTWHHQRFLRHPRNWISYSRWNRVFEEANYRQSCHWPCYLDYYRWNQRVFWLGWHPRHRRLSGIRGC